MDNINPNLPQPGVRPAEWYEAHPDTEATPARAYTLLEKVAAWLLVPLGYLFLRAGLANPFGMLLVLWALLLLTAVLLVKGGYLKDAANGSRWIGLAVYLSAIPGSLALFCSANALIHTGAILYVLLAYGYGVYAITGNTLEPGLSDFVLTDLWRASFLYPCRSLGEMPKAMGLGKGWKQAGRVLGRIIGGLSLTIIPTLAVFALLWYDHDFRDTIASLRTNGDVFDHLCDLLLGAALALPVFGLYAAATGTKKDRITLESSRRCAAAIHVFSSVTSWAAAAPVLILYGLFFFSQWDNYMSAFFGILPEAFSYAAYAREGFFELCTISVINLCMLVATGMFTKRPATEEGKAPVASLAVRILHGTLAVCTLILIATAMSKLVLYIDAYGLTVKRVYAAWLMVLLGLVFVLVIVKQFCPRMKLVALAMATAAVMWLGLGLADVEGTIADYNVDRYLAGTLDVPNPNDLAWELTELGISAVPAKVRVIEAGICSDTIGSEETDAAAQRSREGFFATTLPELRAKDAWAAVSSDH